MKTQIVSLMSVALLCAACPSGHSATQDDLVFIHHSCGQHWLDDCLRAPLVAKDYIDEVNDITYGTDVEADAGRPDSLETTPGDTTEMCSWIMWFNDYLAHVKQQGCANGRNVIVMFKSCYPASDVSGEGNEPGDPFSCIRTLADYRALYRHYGGSGGVYTNWDDNIYLPLEGVFAANPDTLFIPVTAPPYNPTEWGYYDTNAHRARVFNNWLKNDWLSSYNAAHPDLNNVAVFDWFDFLASPDGAATDPNSLKSEYRTGDSHPNGLANTNSTWVFAEEPDNFIDEAWLAFIPEPTAAVFLVATLVSMARRS